MDNNYWNLPIRSRAGNLGSTIKDVRKEGERGYPSADKCGQGKKAYAQCGRPNLYLDVLVQDISEEPETETRQSVVAFI